VAIRVNNLGSVMQALVNLAEARQCYERAERVFTAFLGDDHPRTMKARNKLKSLG